VPLSVTLYLVRAHGRRPFERLIRKLLMLPSRPAVVLLNAYSWFRTEPDTVRAYGLVVGW
jgi:hypothetical protein